VAWLPSTSYGARQRACRPKTPPNLTNVNFARTPESVGVGSSGNGLNSVRPGERNSNRTDALEAQAMALFSQLNFRV
ncbi:MAG: hypothetical protein MPJ50_17400, partial [Pirellulales bacterium]|nr:hypothetical protein [Pirellulales bacterium]